MIDTIICGDCYDVLSGFKNKEIDVVITDPPYGINVTTKKHNWIGGGWGPNQLTSTVNRYKPVINDDVTLNLNELLRVSKNQIIFGGQYFDLPTSRGWIVWDKKTKNGWDNDFSDGELMWTSFNKRLKIFRFMYMGCIQEGKRERREHPTQKPVALMRWIVENYTNEGDLVLDPFAGVGSTLIACKQLDRRYIGIEIDNDYCTIAERRLNEVL